MCSECHQYECPSSCPNASSPQVYAYCELCDKKIYEGEEYYRLADMNICERCVNKAYTTAEME